MCMARILLAVLTVMALSCQGQQLTQGDRDFTVSALHATRKLFLDSVAALSPAQLNWKPAPDRWSVMEVAEHIAVSEESLPQMAAKAMQSPAAPDKRKADARQQDARILAAVAQRDQKAKAPAELAPAGRFKNLAELVAAFRNARDNNIAYVRETHDELRSHFTEGPLGEIDALQVYLLMAGHTERHVKQIREVMAMPGFPKR